MKKVTIKLVVRRETLRVLASVELAHAVGGDARETGAATCPAPAVVDSGAATCPAPAVVATAACG
jgi:hypothetical protein